MKPISTKGKDSEITKKQSSFSKKWSFNDLIIKIVKRASPLRLLSSLFKFKLWYRKETTEENETIKKTKKTEFGITLNDSSLQKADEKSLE